MRRQRFVGLRPRLVILVLIALLPAILLIVFGFLILRDRDRAIARAEVVRLARLIASRKEKELEATRDHLMAVARIPPTTAHHLSESNGARRQKVEKGVPVHDPLLGLLMRHHPHFVSLAIADSDGRVVRSAVPSAEALSVADRPWFRAARRSHRYTVGEYETWGPRHRPVLTVAFPECAGAHSVASGASSGGLTGSLSNRVSGEHAGDPTGEVRQISFAMLDMELPAQAVLDTDLPPHYAASLFDRRGIILSREPDAAKWRGTSLARFPLIADLLAHPSERVEEMNDLDGRRVWAFSPVRVQGKDVAFVGVGIPVVIAYSGARETLRRGVVLLALMTCAIFALAWYIGEKIAAPRLRGLVRMAESIPTGDRGVRTGIQDGDEIGVVAGAFDRMAASLDEREVELRQTEEALREREANYRMLFDTMPVAAAVYDTETLRFLMVNDMAERIYGYTRGEFEGMCVTGIFRPDDVPTMHRWIAENHRESLHSHVWSHRRKDGKIIQVEVVSHFLEVNGRPARLALATDVTERLRATESLRASRDQLRDLANRLQSVREQERTHIARGIHDELGQALTGLKMDLSWLRDRTKQLDGAAQTEAILARIARMSELTDATVQTVRSIATELRPSVLDALGLVPALEWQSRDFANRFGIACAFTSGIEEMRLNQECSTAVFRIFQETLTNVARHAHATSVTTRLECTDRRICLAIEDNGVGISTEALEGGKSLGLLGLRERAQVIGAELDISGRAGEGTRVVLTFPTSERGCLLCNRPCTLRSPEGDRYECDGFVPLQEAPGLGARKPVDGGVMT